MQRPNPLDTLLRRAGATMIEKGGATVAANFGSVAGELAVCGQAVGVADRADLAQVELHGSATLVTEALVSLTGRQAAPGVAAHGLDAWWCRLDSHRVLGICEPGHGEDALAALERAAAATPGVAWSDVSGDHVALGVIGPGAHALLAAAGPIEADDMPVAGAFTDITLGGAPGLLLREVPTLFLLLVPAAHGVRAWHALHEAGEPLGVRAIGVEAFDRYAAGLRARAQQAPEPEPA
jgi:glycine cleavage system aminomethyltransferase T